MKIVLGKLLAFALLFSAMGNCITHTEFADGVVVVTRGPEIGWASDFVIIAITPDMPYAAPSSTDAHDSQICMAEVQDFDQVPCHTAVPLPIPAGLKD
jgi:hypothetical protein